MSWAFLGWWMRDSNLCLPFRLLSCVCVWPSTQKVTGPIRPHRRTLVLSDRGLLSDLILAHILPESLSWILGQNAQHL